MKRTITSLTPAQQARFPEFVDKWIKIGLSTQPADRKRAKRAIKGLYALAELKEPRVIWLPCPISAALSVVCYAAVIQPRVVHGAVGRAVTSALNSSVVRVVANTVNNVVGGAVRDTVDNTVRDTVESAVCSAVRSAVDSVAGSAVDNAVRSAVRNARDSAVGGAVDNTVLYTVNNVAGSAVASIVDNTVRNVVNSAVRSTVGNAVDNTVRNVVNSAVRSAVASVAGSAVDNTVRCSGSSYFGGSLWNVGYCSWADYFGEVCAVEIDRNFLDVTESCGFYWTLDDICFASERPSEIHLDEAGRLHCETGMSICYTGTGWGLYHWHGTRIPGEWIEDSLSPEAVLKQSNLEMRRAGCEILGWSHILSKLKARVVDRDADPQIGELVEVKLPDLQTPAKFLRVRCGTGREFAIGIPPHITKVLDAQAWCIGLEPKDFTCPEVRV